MDRRAGRLRDGALRRFQPAEISGQGAGDGKDPGSDLPLRYSANGIPRRPSRQGALRVAGLRPPRRAAPHALARNAGFEPIDLPRHDRLGELVADVLGVPEVDCAIDCVGFEAKSQGADGKVVEAPAVVLNNLMEITRAAGAIGIPGLYVTDDPGAKEQAAKHGNLSLRLGLGWAKSHTLHTGQTPVLKYNRPLMQAILWDRLPIAEIVNVKVIELEQAPEGYKSFDAGAASKFVIDPHGQLAKAA